MRKALKVSLFVILCVRISSKVYVHAFSIGPVITNSRNPTRLTNSMTMLRQCRSLALAVPRSLRAGTSRTTLGLHNDNLNLDNPLPPRYKLPVQSRYNGRPLFLSTSRSEQAEVEFPRDESNSGAIEEIEFELSVLQNKAQSLTNSDINLNSPKQIAHALYNGGDGGTSKQILQQLSTNDTIRIENTGTSKNEASEDFITFQRDLASLVLRFRSLKRSLQRMQLSETSTSYTTPNSATKGYKARSTNAVAFSTLSSSTIDDTMNPKQSTDVTHESKGKSSHSFSTAADLVDSLFTFQNSKSSIDQYWQEPLHAITKPSARALIEQLCPLCPMGFDPCATPNGRDTKSKTAGKKGTLLAYVRDQKRKYPHTVILTRVGEFYEAFGIDAILMVEFCGLNSMGGKVRAGCPYKNIQATLDGLTNAGFSVSVYEEANDTGAGSYRGRSSGNTVGKKIKNRMLAQIVNPASPTYLYGMVLGDSGSTMDALFGTPSARPYIGVVHSASGYAIVEVSTEERIVRVTERVTAETVACRLMSIPPADPLIYVPSMGEEANRFNEQKLPFLPSRLETDKEGNGFRLNVKVSPPSVSMPEATEGVCDIERLKQCVVTAVLMSTQQETKDDRYFLTHKDFTVLSTDGVAESGSTFTNPLYVETASQLGLLTDPTIPPLVNYLVSPIAPVPTREFLRRWLLTPPPPKVAASMAKLLSYLKKDQKATPNLNIPPIGKVLSIIRAGQASAQTFREVLTSLKSTVDVVDMYSQDGEGRETISSLMEMLRYECGMDVSSENLSNRCLDAIQIIENVVNTRDRLGNDLTTIDPVSNADELIPSDFFERNEAPWRCRIKPEAARDAYDDVEKTVSSLIRAVATDFWGAQGADDISSVRETSSPIVIDKYNNLILLKTIPSWADDAKIYYHPRDRNAKVMGRRYTTRRVDDAISVYIEACENATAAVSKELTKLSETLCDTGHLPAITQAAHLNLILSTACHHAARANTVGWSLAKIVDENDEDSDNSAACQFVDLHPYWMDKSEAISNSFGLNGMVLLTAPNMSGKSTIMRSAAAAALLTNCGFCAPLGPSSMVKRFDSIFVRGASSDVPTENKSAFGAEMGDIAALLRACGKQSYVFVDEIGRGTSPNDGISLAGAILETMASKSMKGFFATHLHPILDLRMHRCAKENIAHMQMETEGTNDGLRWTYKLVNGICRNSHALKTAAQFGIPDHIIKRAEELSSQLPSHLSSSCRQSSDTSTIEESALIGLDQCTMSQPKYRHDDYLNTIIDTITEVSETPTQIQPEWSTPASFEGSSVVYVLLVGQYLYVGETDSFSQRIRQHRKKGGQWKHSTAFAVKVEGGKSNARNLESRLIQSIGKKEGLNLLNTKDWKTKPQKN